MAPLKKLFPTLLWHKSLSISQRSVAQLLEEAYAFRRYDEEGRRWSKKNYAEGYTSYSSIADLHLRSSGFEALKRALDKEVSAFARALEMDLKGRKLELTSCWLNIMGRHTHHSFHLHPLSAISGTFYLKVPKGAGAFKVEDPRIMSFMASPPRKESAKIENRRYVDIECKAGEVILFESWLKHEVPSNRSVEDRVSVSFNYDWV